MQKCSWRWRSASFKSDRKFEKFPLYLTLIKKDQIGRKELVMVPDLDYVPLKPVRQQKVHQKLSMWSGKKLSHILPLIKSHGPKRGKLLRRPGRIILSMLWLVHRCVLHVTGGSRERTIEAYVSADVIRKAVTEVDLPGASRILTSWLLCFHSRAPGSLGVQGLGATEDC